MNYVNFWADVKLNLPEERQNNTLYFVTDAGELYKGSTPIANNLSYTLSGALSEDKNSFINTLTSSTGDKTSSTIPIMTGATSSVDGAIGLVPLATSDNYTQFLRGDGTWQTPTNTVPSAYCSTGATTAAKAATCSGYTLLKNSYLHVIITTSNTKQSKLTLNVNKKGAKSIYINGTVSSATNYTLPAGSYLVYYDGTNYHFRTDGLLPASISGNAATATKADNADSATNANIAKKVEYLLKFGEKEYDGSAEQTITAADLGLSSALKYMGPIDNLENVTNPQSGDVYSLATKNKDNSYTLTGKEMVYVVSDNFEGWIELGDEQSYALKTINIDAGDDLTGGGNLTTNRTIGLPNRLKSAQATNAKLNDANDALTSGFHYISGATTNRPAFKQASDHTGNDYRIWTTAHSDNWLQQIATDFRCNDLFYRRRDNGTWKPWVQIQTTESADGRYAQLAASNTFTNGHIYLGGVTTTSTENKTQLVFGTNTANHIALSSNDKCLILNPTTGSTTNQICLYVNGTTQSVFPKGIAATSSGALPKLGSETRGATNHPVFLDAGEIKVVTLVDTANAMLNSLSAGSSVPEDNDYYISQYVNGGNTTTTYHRRPVSKLYDYMKNKLQGDNVVLEKPIKAYTTLAHNATTNDGRTGYHLIEINSTDNWMLTFTVRLYQGYNYTDIVVSGYNYTGSTKTWHDPKATIIGTHDTQSLDVVFGNSADCKCWVAIPAGNYYGIDIINVTNGYTQIADWTDVFKLSYVASVPTSAKTAVTKTAYAPWYRDETIPVAHGGTGVTTLAEGEAVIGNGSSNVTTRAIVNLTSPGGAGWTGTSSTASNHYLINRNTLSYWDGSYNGTTSNISKLGTITSDLRVDGNGQFNGKNLFYATNNYNTHGAIKFVIGNATSAFAIGGDGLQTWAGAVTVSNNKIIGAGTGTLTAARMYINYYGGNVDIGNPTIAAANLADVFTVSKKNSVFRGTLTVDGAATLNSTLTTIGNITGAYIKGTWLQTTASTNLNAACSKIAVLDDSGWIYYRTPANILSDIGAVGTVNASGTAPLTLSASKSGTTISITGSVATGTTNSVGVVKQHSAVNCTSYSSDEGATTPLAVNQAVHKLSLVGDVSGSFATGTTSDWSMDTTINKALHIGNGSSYIAYPEGGQSVGNGDGITGYLTIQLPAAAWLQTTMVKFKVSIYNYSTHTSVDYIIGVYTYNSGEYLYNPTAICLGKKGEKLSNLPVRFGYQNNKYYIYIGESNTVWNYPNVTISDVTLGHSSDYNKWKEGWSISFGTTLASAIKHIITNTYIGYNAHNADYATNAENATSAGNADTVDGHHFHWSGQSGQPNWLWGGNDSTNMYIYNPSNFSVEKARVVQGNYTANGGQQNPNYFGVNKVGFLMMNTTVNGNSQYKDWIIMDCYSGNDVGGGVALGVNRQSLGAYIMRSDAARTSWAQSAELLHTSNYSSYAIGRKDANGYAGMAIGNADNVWIRTTTQGIIPYQSGGAGSGHQSLGTSSWYFSAAYIDNIYGYLNGNISGSSTSCSGNAVGLSQSGYGNGNLTYHQTSSAHAGSEATWASYIICNHGNGSNYYNQTIRMPFWGPPQYSRMEGGTQKTWWTFLSTENYSSYVLPLTGGTLSNNLYLSATNKGYYLKDSTGYQYPGVYDNGSNLWLGSTATASQHHRGQTYISAGHNGTTGNQTIYISVPNVANNGGTNYAVLHAGNYTNYVHRISNSAVSGVDAYVTLVYDTNYYYMRPYAASKVVCGSIGYPWYKVYTERLAVTKEQIQCLPSYSTTTDYATNVYVGTSGIFSRSTKTSSRTVKHDIKNLENEDIKAENLYKINVCQFKYNEGVISEVSSHRYKKDLPGFIIEDLDEKYPIIIDKPSENVKDWSWNSQYLIPPMLQLIQDQKKQLDKQQEEIDELKELINKLLEKLS